MIVSPEAAVLLGHSALQRCSSRQGLTLEWQTAVHVWLFWPQCHKSIGTVYGTMHWEQTKATIPSLSLECSMLGRHVKVSRLA